MPGGPHQPGRLRASGRTSRSRPSGRIAAFLSEHGRRARHPDRARRPQGVGAAPWRGSSAARARTSGGWQPVGPSACPSPTAGSCRASSTTPSIGDVVEAFAAAARRALAAGFRAARDPRRARLPAARVPLAALATCAPTPTAATSPGARGSCSRSSRPCAPPGRPSCRCPCASPPPTGSRAAGTLDDSVALAALLGPLGVDLVDCSSGGNSPAQQIPLGPGYQVPFAAAIRERAGIATGAGRPDHRAAAGRGHPPGRRGRRRAARARVAARRLVAAARGGRARRRQRRLARAVPASPAPHGCAALTAPLRLSVLDQSPIAEGGTGAEALRNTIDLARLADALGYQRYWVAEHHGMPMLAGAAPEVLIAAIAARDRAHPRRQRRRDAAALQPVQGRRDVQHAQRPATATASTSASAARRAPIAQTMFALQRDRRQLSPDDFPEQLAELLALLRGRLPARPPVRAARRRCPGAPERRRSGCSARRRRARSGPASSACPTRSPTSSTRRAPSIARLYRERFAARRGGVAAAARRPSRVVGDLRRDRRGGASGSPSSQRMAFTLLRQGRLIAVPPVEKALRSSPTRASATAPAAGAPSSARRRRCAPGSRRWPRSTAPTRCIVVTITHDHEARRRSYELIAEAFALERSAAA